ncbi:TonB-dependent receptor; Outer membrane receptor for ferrienterochelin and colicins [hydrothermal vent metagenome]|uniref:TonB-dependent receptor Outer membrane receptor for ferrienterochelin and colicins n=1 Tax=hydrothermal vent metagenome TaxID=652676 RepID=A0A3B0ZLR0_9ZZZZ
MLTAEDIRRSGATSVPEALRMVPGLSVASIDGNKWAISARGFNYLYANKLLVMIDGRSVYSPIVSGVQWDAEDFVLEDIERIEVIRGPGGTMWGANAVNGVINIITSSSSQSQGVLVSVMGGDKQAAASLRYGGRLNIDTTYRVYFKGRQSDSNVAIGNYYDAADDWEQGRGGFRLDWQSSSADQFTIQGDYYRGKNGETLTVPTLPASAFAATTLTLNDDLIVSGSNLLGRWNRRESNGSESMLQLYFNGVERNKKGLEVKHRTFDLEYQYNFQLTSAQNLIWGLGYRHIRNETMGDFSYSLTPANRTLKQWNVFIQDEISFLDNQLKAVFGAKAEKTEFSDVELQPNARLTWTPGSRQTVWGSVSRAVRTPALTDIDARINVSAFAVQFVNPQTLAMETSTNLVSVLGNKEFDSETVTAYELGYRFRLDRTVTLDIATYYNNYDKIMSFTAENSFVETDPAPTHTVRPLRFVNKVTGKTYGLELSANWQPTKSWRLFAGYTYLNLTLKNNDPVHIVERESPVHQLQVRSYYDINSQWQVDAIVYYVDKLKVRDAIAAKNQEVESYVRLDLRLGWRPTSDIELSIVGQNLTDPSHPEFGSVPFIEATEIERNVYVKLNWTY